MRRRKACTTPKGRGVLMSRALSVVLVLAALGPADRLRQGYGGPPKLHAKAEAGHHVLQPRSSIADLKTTPEATDFKSTSSYDNVVKFMKTVDEASPIVFYTTYGTTSEGRAMPLAVVGTGLTDAGPASVKGSGKLRVHIQGNIHAGEVEGKESAQMLLRDLAAGRQADWLRSTVFLITPIFNADGNEKMSLTNRGRQNGPINGMATRATAQGLNITA